MSMRRECTGEKLWFVSDFVGGVRAIAGKGILRPFRGLNIDEWRKRFVRLGAQQFKKWLEKFVYSVFVGPVSLGRTR